MTAVEGKMLTCDMCGKTIFLKFVGEREADGGFTKWREYENADGWTNPHFGKINLGNLCPSCNERLQNALLKTINEIKE